MSEKTKSLKLPFEFDKARLSEDMKLIMNSKWIPHFNKNGYDGSWNAIPLYAPGGDSSNIIALHTKDAKICETHLMKNCLYFKKVLAKFQCPILTARILNLSVGSHIKTHRDHESGYEDGIFRIHVPIATNNGVQFILDDERIVMQEGECWYTNVNYPHSVANNGESDRIHLVIDFERNAWSDELFFSLAPKESFEPDTNENHSPETIQLMIDSLSLMDSPASKDLIEELKLKLNH